MGKTFDFDTHTIYDALIWITSYSGRGRTIQFKSLQNGDRASGIGAHTQVLQRLGAEIISNGIMIQTGYFAEIDPEHVIWKTDTCAMCLLLNLFIDANCTLPFHLSLSLLETITKRVATETDLEFYAEKIDPDTYGLVCKLKPEEFQSLDTGFTSRTAALRQICSTDNPSLTDIHSKISEYIHIRNDIITLDARFSGPYQINHEMVDKIIYFRGEDKEKAMWDDFMQSLDPLELQSVLRIFGNSISLSKRYYIYMVDMPLDIHISACGGMIHLKAELFASKEMLGGLRMYFQIGDEKIRG